MNNFSKKISSAALIALKEALANIYWVKKDLKDFIGYTIQNTSILSTIDWQNNYKYQSAAELVDRMAARPDIYQEDLLCLFREVTNFSDFSHLKKWDDPEKKIKAATEKVEERKKAAGEKRKASLVFSKKLEELKCKFYEIAGSGNPHKRGYDLEHFLNELFTLFDLDPKSSFKIAGEQIDGAFTFDNNDFLLEAKWQKNPVDAGDLYKFAGKLSGKLKNTLGLFISINGFSTESTEVKSEGLKSMVLMDGADMNAILDSRITLNELLYRKRRHASQTGNIYLSIDKIFG